MASMFSNVLGYLCPSNKRQATSSTGSGAGCPLPRDQTTVTGPTDSSSDDMDRENDGNVVYGIEDQDDWQIIKKMSEESSTTGSSEEQEDCRDEGTGEALFALDEDDMGMDDTENRRPGGRACSSNTWYLAPPPCFTRSAASPSTNPLENLLIEHASMSVYLSPVAAFSSPSSRRAALYRSAPPLIMEEHFGPGGRTPTSVGGSPARTRDPTPTTLTELPAVVPNRVPHSKRKRRIRAQRHCGGGLVPAVPVETGPPTAAPKDLGVRTMDEQDKQAQNEDRDQHAVRKLLSKNQLQRGNQMVEANGPKKRTTRDGNYRTLH